jgi:patatin-related protein
MREKELRLALICYGGISLAIYMHGITKEIWRLACASRRFHAGEPPSDGTEAVYLSLLQSVETDARLRLRVLVDIVAGASAGGINGIFLGQAIASGQSLEPLTELWLDKADVEVLIDPDARPLSRFSKFWATPIAWVAAGREGGAVERTVEEAGREEVRAKLSRFVRARWFEPPFGGEGFTHLMLDALDAMAESPPGKPLLPEGQPLDLIVTVTDFHGASRSISPIMAASPARSAMPPRSPSPPARRRASRAPSRPSLSANLIARSRKGAAPGPAATPSSPARCPATPRSARPGRRC